MTSTLTRPDTEVVTPDEPAAPETLTFTVGGRARSD